MSAAMTRLPKRIGRMVLTSLAGYLPGGAAFSLAVVAVATDIAAVRVLIP